MGANAAALRAMGFGPDARHFYAVHVVADAHHQHVAADKLAKGLVEQRPELANDILFGGAAVMALEGAAAKRMIDAWEHGQRSLLSERLSPSTADSA
jgi:hypothetical protein